MNKNLYICTIKQHEIINQIVISQHENQELQIPDVQGY